MKIYRISNSEEPPLYLTDDEGRNIAVNPEHIEFMKTKRTEDVKDILMSNTEPLSANEA